jgi:hypothetical protein
LALTPRRFVPEQHLSGMPTGRRNNLFSDTCSKRPDQSRVTRCHP